MGLVVLTIAFSGAVMSIVGGLTHLRHPSRLAMSLDGHALVPNCAVRAIAQLFPILSVIHGVAFLIVGVFLGSHTRAASGTAEAGLLLYGAMSMYLALLLATKGSRYCNCFGSAARVGSFSLVRVAVPAAAYGYLAIHPAALDGPETHIVSAGIGVVLALGAMRLPEVFGGRR